MTPKEIAAELLKLPLQSPIIAIRITENKIIIQYENGISLYRDK